MTYVLYLSLFGIPNWQFSVNITIQTSLLTFSFENKLNIWLVPIFILVLSGKHAAGQLRHDGTSGGGTERKNGKKVIVLTICQKVLYWASRWCNVNHNFFFSIFHSLAQTFESKILVYFTLLPTIPYHSSNYHL